MSYEEVMDEDQNGSHELWDKVKIPIPSKRTSRLCLEGATGDLRSRGIFPSYGLVQASPGQ